MLASTWQLRDVEDVELLARGVLAEHQRRHDGDLTPMEQEEALLALLEQVVVAEREFEERPGIVFRAWLYARLRHRLIDHLRKAHGRDGRKRVMDTGARDGLLRDLGVDEDEAAAAEEAYYEPRLEEPSSFPLDWQREIDAAFAWAETLERPRPAKLDPPLPERGPRPPALRVVDCVGCGWRHYPTAPPNGDIRWHVEAIACGSCGAELARSPADAADTVSPTSEEDGSQVADSAGPVPALPSPAPTSSGARGRIHPDLLTSTTSSYALE